MVRAAHDSDNEKYNQWIVLDLFFVTYVAGGAVPLFDGQQFGTIWFWSVAANLSSPPAR